MGLEETQSPDPPARPLNSHGGSLVEGATQGAGHVRGAVRQLRGEAEERQVAHAKTALVTLDGILYNAQGFVFRTKQERTDDDAKSIPVVRLCPG